MLWVDRDETSDNSDGAAAAACGSDDDDETRAEDATRTRMSLVSDTIMP